MSTVSENKKEQPIDYSYGLAWIVAEAFRLAEPEMERLKREMLVLQREYDREFRK